MSISKTLNLLKGALLCAVFLVGVGESHAQSIDAPTLCPEVGECFAPAAPEPEPEPAPPAPAPRPSPAPGGAPYDLSAYDIPFAYQWPIAPNTNRTINVPSEMSLSAAAGISRAHVIVAAGTYPSLTINTTDQWFELSNGATINNLLVSRRAGQARTKISGGNIDSGGSIEMSGALDLLIDNVNVNLKGSISVGWSTSVDVLRYAMINSTCVSFDGYCFFAAPQANTEDIILAGNNFQGPLDGAEGTVRGMTTEQFIVVGNRLTNGGKHLLRNHGRSTNTFWGGNSLEPGSGSSIMMVDTPAGQDNSFGGIENVHIVDNRIYLRGSGFHADAQISSRSPQTTRNVTVRGNQIFTDSSSPSRFNITTGGGIAAQNLSASGNSIAPFRTPPSAAQLGVGADH